MGILYCHGTHNITQNCMYCMTSTNIKLQSDFELKKASHYPHRQSVECVFPEFFGGKLMWDIGRSMKKKSLFLETVHTCISITSYLDDPVLQLVLQPECWLVPEKQTRPQLWHLSAGQHPHNLQHKLFISNGYTVPSKITLYLIHHHLKFTWN